jgi:hypothetical protein
MPIGQIRAVNPDRGLAPAALAGRLLAVSDAAGAAFELVALEGGCQYHPGRSFGREELRRLARGGGPPPGPLDWRVFGPWGVERLKAPPATGDLAALAAEALRLAEERAEALLDRFEVWASDKASGRPLALLATAVDYVEAEAIGFAPGPTGRVTDRYDHTSEIWRFCEPHLLRPEAEAFQRRVNAKIRTDAQPGLYPFLRRIFERLPDGSAVEHDRGRTRPVPAGYVPAGHLAEPLESERISLLRALRGVGRAGA